MDRSRGYNLTQHPDPELEKTADGAIDIVCAAQLDNGYLDAYYILNGMDRAFHNLRWHRELYCLGHLVEEFDFHATMHKPKATDETE